MRQKRFTLLATLVLTAGTWSMRASTASAADVATRPQTGTCFNACVDTCEDWEADWWCYDFCDGATGVCQDVACDGHAKMIKCNPI